LRLLGDDSENVVFAKNDVLLAVKLDFAPRILAEENFVPSLVTETGVVCGTFITIGNANDVSSPSTAYSPK